MATTSQRGATGFLPRLEFTALLRRANASARVSGSLVDETIQAMKEAEQQQQLPKWLCAASTRERQEQKQLNAWQVTNVMLGLCTSSRAIRDLFGCYANKGEMRLDEWLAFIRTEQLGLSSDAQDESVGEPSAVATPTDRHFENEAILAQATQRFHLLSSSGKFRRLDDA
eukprot:2447806-Prymnesium_polylepis.1